MEQNTTGIGVVQRTILKKLEKHKYVILSDIRGHLPHSTRRSAANLEERGLIRTWVCPIKKRYRGARLQYYTVATLPDVSAYELEAMIAPQVTGTEEE